MEWSGSIFAMKGDDENARRLREGGKEGEGRRMEAWHHKRRDGKEAWKKGAILPLSRRTRSANTARAERGEGEVVLLERYG